jgi:hypothetical protein
MRAKSTTAGSNVRPVTRLFLSATRLWLPVAIAVAGVVGIVIGHGRTGAAGAGVGLLIVALTVWMINWMFRMSVQSNRERDREEEARAYFERTGRWPDDP